jgi:hypothetical protein
MSTTKRMGFCAYCGRRRLVEREHVVPIGIFPISTRSAARFVLRDACSECNRDPSGDEEDLRNFLPLAGIDSKEAKELFDGPMKRAFEKLKGKGPFTRLIDMMTKDDALDRYRIKPSDAVFRALNKIVRGLTHHHFDEVIAERRVEIVFCPHQIPEELIKDSDFTDVHRDVFRYWFVGMHEPEIHSVWLMKLLQDRVFCAMVHP